MANDKIGKIVLQKTCSCLSAVVCIVIQLNLLIDWVQCVSYYQQQLNSLQSSSVVGKNFRRLTRRSAQYGGYALDTSLYAVTCDVRSSCRDDKQSTAPLTWVSRQQQFAERNCFCDDLCTVYQDCCSDYVGPSHTGVSSSSRVSDKFGPSSPGFIDTVSCERLLEIDAEREIYVVTSCPKSFADVYVRAACENVGETSVGVASGGGGGASGGGDTLRHLPVTSRTTGILYRNFFCAQCAGDVNVTFWLARLSCSDPPGDRGGGGGGGSGGGGGGGGRASSEDAQDLLRATLRRTNRQSDCEIEYRHVDPNFITRGCKSNIGRCDRRWTSVVVSRLCRASTSYVYAGLRTFRNVHCARCNFVNMSYIGCDDHRTLLASAPTPPDDVINSVTPPFTVTVDLNSHVAVILRRRFNHNGASIETSEVNSRVM